jgi:hypothetical protein
MDGPDRANGRQQLDARMHRVKGPPMTLLAPLVLILLAQAPAAPGGPARYKVTIESRGVVWGSASETDGSCPGSAPGSDTLTGIVEGTEPPLFKVPPCKDDDCERRRDVGYEEGVIYKGMLTRTTTVDLCEVKDTSDGDRWCLGHLNGGGPVEVTIFVPIQWRDSENLRVKMQPGPKVTAKAIGACSTLDNAELEVQYTSEDSIYFETSDDPGARVPATGRLFVGSVKSQTRIPPRQPGGEYTLKVEPAP